MPMILNEEQNMLKDSAKDFCTNNAPIGQLRELRSHIGMIFQTFNLVKRTSVINNVLMGRLHVLHGGQECPDEAHAEAHG